MFSEMNATKTYYVDADLDPTIDDAEFDDCSFLIFDEDVDQAIQATLLAESHLRRIEAKAPVPERGVIHGDAVLLCELQAMLRREFGFTEILTRRSDGTRYLLSIPADVKGDPVKISIQENLSKRVITLPVVNKYDYIEIDSLEADLRNMVDGFSSGARTHRGTYEIELRDIRSSFAIWCILNYLGEHMFGEFKVRLTSTSPEPVEIRQTHLVYGLISRAESFVMENYAFDTNKVPDTTYDSLGDQEEIAGQNELVYTGQVPHRLLKALFQRIRLADKDPVTRIFADSVNEDALKELVDTGSDHTRPFCMIEVKKLVDREFRIKGDNENAVRVWAKTPKRE